MAISWHYKKPILAQSITGQLTIPCAYKSLLSKRLITKVANTIFIEESGIAKFIKEQNNL